MDKYIGFDIDTVKTAVCVIQKGKKEKFYTPCGPKIYSCLESYLHYTI